MLRLHSQTTCCKITQCAGYNFTYIYLLFKTNTTIFPYKYKCPDLPILINFQGRNWRNNVASSRQAVLVGSWSFYCRSHLIWEKYVSANHLIAVTQMSARQWWEPISAATTCWRDCDPHQVHRTHDFWHPASVWCNEALNNGMLVAFVACLLQTIENVWS